MVLGKMDKGMAVIGESNQPVEATSENHFKAFKSPKKRVREEVEKVPEESEPSVEILGAFDPHSNTIEP